MKNVGLQKYNGQAWTNRPTSGTFCRDKTGHFGTKRDKIKDPDNRGTVRKRDKTGQIPLGMSRIVPQRSQDKSKEG